MSRNNKESKRLLKVIADLVALGAQVTGFFIWPMVINRSKSWTVPVAIFLVSAGWWENYVDRKSPIGVIKRLGKVKDRLAKTRYFVYSFISLLKMVIFFSCMLLFLHLNGVSIGTLFSQIGTAFRPHPINVTQINPVTGRLDNALPDIPGKNRAFKKLINDPFVQSGRD